MVQSVKPVILIYNQLILCYSAVIHHEILKICHDCIYQNFYFVYFLQT